MDKLFILIIFSLQTILFLMGHITLKHRTNALQKGIDKQKECWESVGIQNNKINKEIEEKAQFEEKALGTLAKKIEVCGYELKEVKDKLEIVNNNTLLVRQSNFEIDSNITMVRERDFKLGQDISELKNNDKVLKDITTECMLCLERQIDASKEEINKTIKDESAKNIFTYLERGLYKNELVRLKKRV